MSGGLYQWGFCPMCDTLVRTEFHPAMGKKAKGGAYVTKEHESPETKRPCVGGIAKDVGFRTEEEVAAHHERQEAAWRDLGHESRLVARQAAAADLNTWTQSPMRRCRACSGVISLITDGGVAYVAPHDAEPGARCAHSGWLWNDGGEPTPPRVQEVEMPGSEGRTFFDQAGKPYTKDPQGNKVYTDKGGALTVVPAASQQAIDAELIDDDGMESDGDDEYPEGEEPETIARRELERAEAVKLSITCSPERLREVLDTYLDGRPFDVARITSECLAYTDAAGRAVFELGKRLVAMKEIVGHGSFGAWLHANMPFSARYAQMYMAIANGAVQRPGIARIAGGQMSKSYALLSLPDEYLDEMADRGTLDGKPVEDYVTMPQRKLLDRIKSLKNRRTHLEEENKQFIAERADHVKQITHLKNQVYDLVHSLKPTDDTPLTSPKEANALALMERLQTQADYAYGQLERFSLEECSPELAGRVLALGSYLYFRAERCELRLRQRCAEAGFAPPPPELAWAQNERRRETFEGVIDTDVDPSEQ